MTVDGVSYDPRTIQRTRYSQDSLGRKNNITLSFAGNDMFARQYLNPSTVDLGVDVATLTGVVFYRGKMIAVSYQDKNNTIAMVFEPTIRLDRRTMGERRLFQINCPYLVYDSNCGATQVEHRMTVTAIRSTISVQLCFDTGNVNNATSNNRFVVLPSTTGVNQNIGDLIGGLVKTTTHEWWITNITGVTALTQFVYFDVVLFRPHSFTVNQSVNAVFGCKRVVSDCESLHNNLERYGGFPRQVRRSPFQGGLQ